MVNRRRGEVEAVIGGRAFTLCLTLGALAELEHAFAVDDLGALGERFATGRLSARDLARILAVAIRGGGMAISDDEVAALPAVGLDNCVRALSELLAATFGAPEESSANPRPAAAEGR